MPTTSTSFNACDASIWLDDVNGVLRDISGSSNNLDVNFDHELGDFVVFQDKWPQRLECGKDATFTLRVICSTTASEAWDVLKDWYFASSPGARTFVFYMPDKNVGSDRFNGECRLENLTWTIDRSDPAAIMVTATLRPDGAYEHSDVAT